MDKVIDWLIFFQKDNPNFAQSTLKPMTDEWQNRPILLDNKKSADFCMSHNRKNRPILSADFVGDKLSSRTWF